MPQGPNSHDKRKIPANAPRRSANSRLKGVRRIKVGDEYGKVSHSQTWLNKKRGKYDPTLKRVVTAQPIERKLNKLSKSRGTSPPIQDKDAKIRVSRIIKKKKE